MPDNFPTVGDRPSEAQEVRDVDNVWPPVNTLPTPTNPYYCSGEYRDHPYHVSPEGVAYGTTRRIWRWPHPYWWDGSQYRDVEVAGEAYYFSELPAGPRPFGEIWRVRFMNDTLGVYEWRQYYWNSESSQWLPLKWLWSLDHKSELPTPGFAIGDAHMVIESDVMVFWNNFQWVRPNHSAMNDDEPERHLPAGFLKWVSPDARVVYVSPTEIGIESVEGGTGQVWVNGEYIQAQRSASVLNALPSLEWDSQTSTIVPAFLDIDTEYWVYLANTLSPEYLIQPIESDGLHPATPYWDFKGKLFLSRSADVNGYLSDTGAGLNARLVGKVQTDSTSPAAGGPYFLRELNISIISRTTNFPETYRDYSDYQVQFVNYDTLRMALLDGAYGQIYVGGNLEYLGENFDITLDDAWISWDDNVTDKLVRNETALSASSRYYIYLSADVDMFNFNVINPETNRPWISSDRNAESNYVAALDMRLKPFLSSQTPDHGRLSEQWPGYYTRLIGTVSTDANSRFINARDLSAIRQPTLNPVYFDGLAEVAIRPLNSGEFQIVKKKGTSGIVQIAGEGVQTYEEFTSSVHRVTTDLLVQDYTESNLNDPLSALDAVSTYPSTTLYLYMANSRDFWGSVAGRLFVSNVSPVNGFLSSNWPGSNARWLATIKTDRDGRFTGSYLLDAVSQSAITIDDYSTSLTGVWSSAKVAAEFDKVWTSLNVGLAWERQLESGILASLSFEDANTIRFAPISGGPITVAFPDTVTSRVVDSDGLHFAVSGAPETIYYCYLPPIGDPYVSTEAPTGSNGAIDYIGNDILVGWVGFASDGSLKGSWNIYSRWQEPERVYSHYTAVWGYHYLGLDGIIVPPGTTGALRATGYLYVIFEYSGGVRQVASVDHFPGDAVVYFPMETWASVFSRLSHSSVSPGVYSSSSLNEHDQTASNGPYAVFAEAHVTLTLTIGPF